MATPIIHRSALRLIAASVVATATAASAETITISGRFPAQNREASYLQRLAIDRFAGRDGEPLANAIAAALSRAENASGPHFTLLGDTGGRAPRADGVLSGSATSDWEEHRVTLQRRRCIERAAPKDGKKRRDDDEGECLKYADVPVPCMQRTTTLTASLRLVRIEDGAIVYTASKPRNETVSWCPRDTLPRAAEMVIADMIDSVAGETRGDIAPHGDTYKVRYREDRAGLSKPLAARFKDVLRLSKSDSRGACEGWEAIDRDQPGQLSIVFNRGLCAEQRGDYPVALTLYRQARGMKSADDINTAIGRAQALIAGTEDEARFRRRRG